MSRLPPLDVTELNERQRAIYESGGRSRPGVVAGPVRAQILVPDLAERCTALSEYLRKQTSLNARVLELAMLLCAREWTSQYVWFVHETAALKAGVAASVIEAVKHGRTPQIEAEDEATAYAYVRELFETRRIGDATYARAVAAFGEAGLVELVNVVGYYTLLAMTVNTFGILPVSGDTPLA